MVDDENAGEGEGDNTPHSRAYNDGMIGGRYGLEELLAEGAFARVFLASNQRTYQQVAVKQVSKKSASQVCSAVVCNFCSL
jgi:hypothetical protein